MPILRALDPDGPGSIGLEHFLQLAAACSAPRLGDGGEESAGAEGDGGYAEGDGGGYYADGDGGDGEAADDQAPRQDEEGDPKVLEFIR